MGDQHSLVINIRGFSAGHIFGVIGISPPLGMNRPKLKEVNNKDQTQQSNSKVPIMIWKTLARGRVWNTPRGGDSADPLLLRTHTRPAPCAQAFCSLSGCESQGGLSCPFAKEATRMLTPVGFKPPSPGPKPTLPMLGSASLG